MKHSIQHSKTYRYFTNGKTESSDSLLIVMHGYGQLAEFFIKKFEGIPDRYFILAPEGMHRFYLKGSSGRVGASWMTKEERETDISDNISWLTALLESITKEKKFKKIIILGFSQGAATAARWFYNKGIADHLIMWAGVFPPDLNIEAELKLNSEHTNYFVLGKEDEYFDEVSHMTTMEFYRSINFVTKTFDGKHDIDMVVLKEILEDL